MDQRLVIHTTAGVAQVRSMFPGAWVAQGTTGIGEPDCFYGWGEPAGGICIPHTLILTDNFDAVKEMTRELVSRGHQTTTTLEEDYSEIINCGAMLYRDEHQH